MATFFITLTGCLTQILKRDGQFSIYLVLTTKSRHQTASPTFSIKIIFESYGMSEKHVPVLASHAYTQRYRNVYFPVTNPP